MSNIIWGNANPIRYTRSTPLQQLRSWWIKLPMNRERVLAKAQPAWNPRFIKN